MMVVKQWRRDVLDPFNMSSKKKMVWTMMIIIKKHYILYNGNIIIL